MSLLFINDSLLLFCVWGRISDATTGDYLLALSGNFCSALLCWTSPFCACYHAGSQGHIRVFLFLAFFPLFNWTQHPVACIHGETLVYPERVLQRGSLQEVPSIL